MKTVYVEGLRGFHWEQFSAEVRATTGTLHPFSAYPGQWHTSGPSGASGAADFDVYGTGCKLYGDVPEAFVQALEKYKVKNKEDEESK